MNPELETRALTLTEQMSLHNAFAERLGDQFVLTTLYQDDLNLNAPHHADPHKITAAWVKDGDVAVSVQQGSRTQLFQLPSAERTGQNVAGVASERVDNAKYDSFSRRDHIRAHHLGVLALCYKALATEFPDASGQAAPEHKLAQVASS